MGIAAGAVAIIIAGGVAVWSLAGRGPSAEETAEAYLKALSEGDAAAVRDLLDTEPEPENFTQIEAAFAGADSYLTDYEFELADDNSVRARVTLGGAPGVVFFILSEGADGFRVNGDFLAILEATTTLGDSVTVGGALVPASAPVPLLPAVYTVAAAPTGILAGETTVIVTNETPITVAVEASVSSEATALAAAQLEAYARACAATNAMVPENCGLRVPWAADLATLSSIAFRIDQLPVLVLADDATTFAATGGVIVATATGSTPDGTAASFTYRADDWALRGVIEFTGDSMALRVT